MHQSISKHPFIIAVCISILIVCFQFIKSNSLQNTRIVFCNVGQGDGIYIRVKNAVDILIDAGPGSQILQCLSNYMPFYDRTIELAFITHPQKDHYYGFISVLDHYTVQNIYGSFLKSESKTYRKLLDKLNTRGLPMKQLTAQDMFLLPGSRITAFWPTQQFLDKSKNTSVDPNDYSMILLFEEGETKALLTGDATTQLLNGLLEQSELKATILKVPHHGSKEGLTNDFLLLADPQVAVISVGKNNTYGHPSQALLKMLEANHIQVRRTDLEGTIVFELN